MLIRFCRNVRSTHINIHSRGNPLTWEHIVSQSECSRRDECEGIREQCAHLMPVDNNSKDFRLTGSPFIICDKQQQTGDCKRFHTYAPRVSILWAQPLSDGFVVLAYLRNDFQSTSYVLLMLLMSNLHQQSRAKIEFLLFKYYWLFCLFCLSSWKDALKLYMLLKHLLNWSRNKHYIV